MNTLLAIVIGAFLGACVGGLRRTPVNGIIRGAGSGIVYGAACGFLLDLVVSNVLYLAHVDLPASTLILSAVGGIAGGLIGRWDNPAAGTRQSSSPGTKAQPTEKQGN